MSLTAASRRWRSFLYIVYSIDGSMNAMSSLLQIRQVPDEVRRALKARAAARGESMNAYLLNLLEREIARPTAAEVLDRAARRSERALVSAMDVIGAARSERDDHRQQVPTR